MDLDAFYPERTGDGPDPKDVIAETRKVCAGCPVREPCAAWAVERGEHGLWGGTTDGERRTMRRQAA